VTVCGTPFYFSPELIQSEPYREPSDVWALGVLLFELLTLTRPFNGNNIAVLALNITKGAYAGMARVRPRLARSNPCGHRPPLYRSAPAFAQGCPLQKVLERKAPFAASTSGGGCGGGALLPAQSCRFHRVLRTPFHRYSETALEASPYPEWVRNLASKERLLHPNPRMRLRLPDLLAAITGPSLDRFAAAGGTTPLGMRKGSFSSFGSKRTSSRRGSGAFAT